MNILARFFSRYTGLLRGLKLSYVLNNLLHGKDLSRNKGLYRRFGLKKSVYAPIGYQDFQNRERAEVPWLDRPNALEALEQSAEFSNFSVQAQQQLKRFVQDGFMVLEDFVPDALIDQLNAEVEANLRAGATGFNYTGRKVVDFFQQSEVARVHFFQNPELLRLFRFVMQKEIIPFQSLNFIQGSEQRPHSDSIHMMTEPPGFMIAAWYALEDCTAMNGPLVYYPGSHRLPYITTLDYPSGNTVLTIGAHSNERYEQKIAAVIEENQLKPAYFLAKKGSVLIWHANLIHGGSPIKQAGSTRKSMVCHYYADEVICYHEMSQRPAILPKVK
jgi:ectoine hydroxylase